MQDPEEFTLLLKAAYRENERRVLEQLQLLDITPAHGEVLRVLNKTGPLSLGELGEYLIVDTGHPSRLVDRMVKLGYLNRQPAPGDRRRIEISLTDLGIAKVEQIQQMRKKLIENAAPFLEQNSLEPVKVLMRNFLAGSHWLKKIERRLELNQSSNFSDK
ncbi:MAG: MarR family transcriptional regulator [Chloroflexota bacterium]